MGDGYPIGSASVKSGGSASDGQTTLMVGVQQSVVADQLRTKACTGSPTRGWRCSMPDGMSRELTAAGRSDRSWHTRSVRPAGSAREVCRARLYRLSMIRAVSVRGTWSGPTWSRTTPILAGALARRPGHRPPARKRRARRYGSRRGFLHASAPAAVTFRRVRWGCQQRVELGASPEVVLTATTRDRSSPGAERGSTPAVGPRRCRVR
jgi:hypothetical protein